MKLLLPLLLILSANLNCFAQNYPSRIILIGDAGRINKEQDSTLRRAAHDVKADSTLVFFLGDNIYPRGYSLGSKKKVRETENILKSQYDPMVKAQAKVNFLPGNHDENGIARRAFKKINKAGQYLRNQDSTNIQLIPANGCPGPVKIDLSSKIILIAYDRSMMV